MSYSKPLIAAAIATVVALSPMSSPAGAQPAPATVKAAGSTKAKSFKIGTYNIQKPSKSRPWSKRRTKVAALIRSRKPDILGIQEANGPHKGSTKKFPARDLKRQLGYGMVKTRTYRGERRESITGRYLLYRTKRFVAGRNHEFSLGHRSYTVWSTFRDRATGARFIVVNSHVVNGNTAARDRVRRAQTKLLIRKMRKVNTQKLPVIHVGDFNTHRDHRSDAPTKVFRSVGYKNTYSSARKRYARKYNSSNQLRRVPPKKYMHADYIWVPKGTVVWSWSQALKLRRGKFVGTIPSDHNPIFASIRVRYDR